MKERRQRTTNEILEGLTLDQGIRERLATERRPVLSVDGDDEARVTAEETGEDDDLTQCIDGAGNGWPEHDESGYAECRRCGAELY